MEQSESSPRLADVLASLLPVQIGVKCYTCAMLESMPSEDRDAFEEAIESGSFSDPTLVKALSRAGYRTSRGSLARHRRGECKPVH
jgi:hypothetical protein